MKKKKKTDPAFSSATQVHTLGESERVPFFLGSLTSTLLATHQDTKIRSAGIEATIFYLRK